MDFEIMKKKMDAYRSPKGSFKNVKGDLLVELLRMWESHTGSSSDMARKLGMKVKQLGRLVSTARRIAVNSDVVDATFHELKMQEAPEIIPTNGIEVMWGQGKLIRFPSVDTLMDFLKKAS
jgi:hypothetical protein